MVVVKKITLRSPCPPPVLTDAEIQVAKRVRERVDDFIQVYQKINNCEPSDVEIKAYLKCQGRSDVIS